MIELVFSDSACGSLKFAQHCGEGEYVCGAVSIGIIVSHADGSKPTKAEIKAARREAEESTRQAWEKAVPMGGNSSDVYGLPLALSVGDISHGCFGDNRRRILERLYGVYPDGEEVDASQQLCQRVASNLVEVERRMKAGETVRIWYSDQPDEMCGLYWFIAELQQWKVSAEQIFTVKLPGWEADGEAVIQRSSWGEVAPGEWHRYTALQEPVPAPLFQRYVSSWQTLQKENAPLRAVLNGKLVSMPETVYDDFIMREIAAEEIEFREANVIGRILGNYQLGISDWWIAFRIEKMVQDGLLEVVTPAGKNMPDYHRMLKKRT